jgi:hypothetical protein
MMSYGGFGSIVIILENILRFLDIYWKMKKW